MSRVVHFEIHAADPQRAIAFYGGLFGWDFKPYGPPDFYWLITTGEEDAPGINGGLLRRAGGAKPEPGTAVIAYVCTIDVDDLDQAIADVENAGGTVAQSKHAIPGVGWQAYARDPEGNVFGLHQADPNAN